MQNNLKDTQNNSNNVLTNSCNTLYNSNNRKLTINNKFNITNQNDLINLEGATSENGKSKYREICNNNNK